LRTCHADQLGCCPEALTLCLPQKDWLSCQGGWLCVCEKGLVAGLQAVAGLREGRLAHPSSWPTQRQSSCCAHASPRLSWANGWLRVVDPRHDRFRFVLKPCDNWPPAPCLPSAICLPSEQRWDALQARVECMHDASLPKQEEDVKPIHKP
jgi:hypothetical protein